MFDLMGKNIYHCVWSYESQNRMYIPWWEVVEVFLKLKQDLHTATKTFKGLTSSIRHVKLIGTCGSQSAKKCETWLPNFEDT